MPLTSNELPTQSPVNLASAPANREGRPVRDSRTSATCITRNPALTPSHRNGSDSHLGLSWPTHGKLTSSLGRSRIRSANVRPARLVQPTPSPT